MSPKLNQMQLNASPLSANQVFGKPRISKLAAGTIVLTMYCFCSVLIYWKTGITPYNFHDSSKTSELYFFNSVPRTSSKNDTKQDNEITLNDIFFSVRIKNLDKNDTLLVVLKTWFQLVRNQTWIFTDPDFQNRHLNCNLTDYLKSLSMPSNNHLVVTNCTDDYNRKRFCCIISTEFQYFLTSSGGKKWLCSFEDDHYVNVPRVLEVLQKYNYSEDWYLGRNTSGNDKETENGTIRSFTDFSAGMCMTRTLMLKLHPVIVNSLFTEFCENELYTLDVAIRNFISHSTKNNLTALPEFHSNHDLMNLIPKESFRNQISLSYFQNNVLNVSGFNESYDPTRFLSLHCYLFPHLEFCRSNHSLINTSNLFG